MIVTTDTLIDSQFITMTSSNAVLVFGATGVIGRYIISALTQAQPSFQRVGIFTSASTAQNKSEQIQKLKDANVEIHVGDIESEDDVSKALEGTPAPYHIPSSA